MSSAIIVLCRIWVVLIKPVTKLPKVAMPSMNKLDVALRLV